MKLDCERRARQSASARRTWLASPASARGEACPSSRAASARMAAAATRTAAQQDSQEAYECVHCSARVPSLCASHQLLLVEPPLTPSLTQSSSTRTRATPRSCNAPRAATSPTSTNRSRSRSSSSSTSSSSSRPSTATSCATEAAAAHKTDTATSTPNHLGSERWSSPSTLVRPHFSSPPLERAEADTPSSLLPAVVRCIGTETASESEFLLLYAKTGAYCLIGAFPSLPLLLERDPTADARLLAETLSFLFCVALAAVIIALPRHRWHECVPPICIASWARADPPLATASASSRSPTSTPHSPSSCSSPSRPSSGATSTCPRPPRPHPRPCHPSSPRSLPASTLCTARTRPAPRRRNPPSCATRRASAGPTCAARSPRSAARGAGRARRSCASGSAGRAPSSPSRVRSLLLSPALSQSGASAADAWLARAVLLRTSKVRSATVLLVAWLLHLVVLHAIDPFLS